MNAWRAQWPLSVAVLVAALTTQHVAAQVGHSTCPNVVLSSQQLGPNSDMTFTRSARSNQQVLIAEGAVTNASPQALRAALQAGGGVQEIWLRSSGGNAVAGNEMASIIRRSGIPIRIPGGWWCISACNFIFFGGALRSIDPGGVFAVHMATVVNSEKYQNQAIELAKKGSAGAGVWLKQIAEREQSMAMLTAYDIDIILRMGISRKLLSEVMYAQRADQFVDNDGDGKFDFGKAETYRCLTRSEMARYNVVNVD